MGQLVVTIPNAAVGVLAQEHLQERAETDLGCRYESSLSSRLRGLNAEHYLELLPFTFHLITTADGDEIPAMNRILRWHSGETREPGHGRVESVEPNFPLYPLAPLGLPFQLGGAHGEYLGQMGVDVAHRNNVKGGGIRIAILDTGLDPAATAKAKDFYDLEDAPIHAVPSTPKDIHGHGTAMAELIHAVASEAEIWVIRVSATGPLNLWNLLAGTGVAIADCDADIVNLSVGYSKMEEKCACCGAPLAVRKLAFEKLLDTGTPGTAKLPIYVAATGNSGSSNGFEFPASLEKCVAVGAVDRCQRRALFSNFGARHGRHLVAPGGQAPSPTTADEDVGTGAGKNACSGTSVATAYVSGLLALFRSEPRYAVLGRDDFVANVLANHCTVPTHTTQLPGEYGSGIIKYSPPPVNWRDAVVLEKALQVNKPLTLKMPAAQEIRQDGEHVYIGHLRLDINKRS